MTPKELHKRYPLPPGFLYEKYGGKEYKIRILAKEEGKSAEDSWAGYGSVALLGDNSYKIGPPGVPDWSDTVAVDSLDDALTIVAARLWAGSY